MDSVNILVTRPRYDLPTTYLHFFSGELIKLLEGVGEYNIINLHEDRALRKNFEKVINKKKPRLMILNGHGSKNAVYGHKEPILDERNIHLLESSIVYAVACDSAYNLGDIAIEKGKADSYIGYESHFMVIIDKSKTTTLHKDKNIKPFQSVYMHLILQIISGLTVGESVDRTKKFIESLIREYGVEGVRDKFGDAPLIRFALYWNLFFLGYHGEPSVKM